MKKTLLFSCCLITAQLFAQSFTAANEFIVGDTQTMYMCDSAAPSYAAVVGTGMTWDYSSYGAVNNPNRTYEIIANANTANFPNANKVVNIQGALSTYLLTSASNRSSEGFEFVDAALGTIRANFSAGDNMNMMDYDFNFNATINDVFSGTLTGTGVINPACAGTSVSSFDATGSIILSPTVTKTNVQRHHMYSELNGSSIVGPVLIKTNQFEYYDFAGSKLPVFSYTNVKIYVNGNLSSNMNFVLNTELPANTAIVLEKESVQFTAHPNPVTDKLTITGNNFSGNEIFKIIDISGKNILTSRSNSIDVNSLQSGVYFVEMNGSSVRQKFIKK